MIIDQLSYSYIIIIITITIIINGQLHVGRALSLNAVGIGARDLSNALTTQYYNNNILHRRRLNIKSF